jgi:hypothetical protein
MWKKLRLLQYLTTITRFSNRIQAGIVIVAISGSHEELFPLDWTVGGFIDRWEAA